MAFPLTDSEHAAIKRRIDSQAEIVVGAAVRYDGLTVSVERPGRHGDCLNWLHRHGVGRGVTHECGFVTNRGRFVGREGAGRIVLSEEQGSPGGTPENNPRMALFSEDMWNDSEREFAAPISAGAIF
jgi:hypothetical protein